MRWNGGTAATIALAIYLLNCGAIEPPAELPFVKPPFRRLFHAYAHWSCAPNDAANAVTIYITSSPAKTLPPSAGFARIYVDHAGPPELTHHILRWHQDAVPYQPHSGAEWCRSERDCTVVQKGSVTFGDVKLGQSVEGEINIFTGGGNNVFRGAFEGKWMPRYDHGCI